MTRVAAVDCGTNSIRLLVADADPAHGELKDLERRMEIVRLGQGVDRTGRLAPEALERTFAVCREYARAIEEHGARRVRFVATSASRDAENRDEFVRGVVDIYYGKPFTIPALESVTVRPEVLDKYVGVYASPDAPAKATITRDGSTLFFKPPGAASAVPLEATAENRFQIEGVAVIEFEKGRMTVKRRGGERVFTKEE